MGNANGREEGENGGGEYPPRRSDGGDFLENSGCRVRVPSLDAMGNNTPPESPGRSQSPLLFAPQVPVAPLQRAADIPPVFNQPFMNDSRGPLDLPPEQGIPTMITWNYGGKDVAVEGSWDNWTSRKTLQRTGKDHSILLVLPSGIYQYKFIVDGEWRYIPDLPCVADEMGHITNLLDVHDYVPENLESVVEFGPPPSPDSSYGQPFPVDGDFSKEPLAVPSQLHLTILGMQNPTEAASSLKPQHVVLNHLYIEKRMGSSVSGRARLDPQIPVQICNCGPLQASEKVAVHMGQSDSRALAGPTEIPPWLKKSDLSTHQVGPCPQKNGVDKQINQCPMLIMYVACQMGGPA